MVPRGLLLLLGFCLCLECAAKIPATTDSAVPGIEMPPDYMFGDVHGCSGRSLLVSPSNGMGLNNQVNLLVNAIYIGLLTHRNVCLHSFGISYDSDEHVNAAWIYDLAYINAAIANTGIIGRIAIKNPMIKQPISVRLAHAHDYAAATCLILKGQGGNGMRQCPYHIHKQTLDIRKLEKNFVGILQFLKRVDIRNIEKIALTPGIPGQRVGFDSEEDEQHIHDIHLLLRFAPAFYELTNRLLHKNEIEPGDTYTAVHFRLEDDALQQYWNFNWWEYEELEDVKAKKLKFMWPREEHDVWLGAKFLQQIVRTVPRTEKLYMTSGLHKRKNKLNFVLDFLDKYYVNMKANDLLNSPADVSLKELLMPIRGREVAAIVDYIIAARATHFIGISASTFSANVMRALKHRKGILDKDYGKAQVVLHERNPLYNPLLPKTPDEHLTARNRAALIASKRKVEDLDLLQSFAAKSFMFSIRDMNLTATLPTDLRFLNETLAVPGVCSGIQFINAYRKANCMNKNSPLNMKKPWMEYLTEGADEMIPEQEH